MLIRPSDAEYMKVVRHVAEALTDSRVAFFTGAGISIPSGLPGGKHLKDTLIDTIANSLRRLDIGSEEERQTIRRSLCSQPLERLLEFQCRAHGDVALEEFLDVLTKGQPNLNHNAIASLCATGGSNAIVTLNFDTLHEQALLKQGVLFRRTLPLAAFEDRYDHDAEAVPVLKLHGTLPLQHAGYPWQDYFLAATLQQCGDSPQPENHQALQSVAESCDTLVVMGYAGEDCDIFPLLRSMKWSTVVWIKFPDGSDLSSSVRKWMSRRQKGPTGIAIEDDSRCFLANLLYSVGADNWPNRLSDRVDIPLAQPRTRFLRRNAARTAWAGVRLLSGAHYRLYADYVDRFQAVPLYGPGGQDHPAWLRALAWYVYVQFGDARRAIALRYQADRCEHGAKPSPLGDLANAVDHQYHWLAAAKRLYLNPRSPYALGRAALLGRRVRRQARSVVGKAVRPWVKKEVLRITGLSKWHTIDLMHDWGYHLLFFDGAAIRGLAARYFRWVAMRYARIARSAPPLRTGYYYVRRIEARILAAPSRLGTRIDRDLAATREMFEWTGRRDHAAYAGVVLALLYRLRGQTSSRRDFASARRAALDERWGGTLGARLRFLFLDRHFWPAETSFGSALRQTMGMLWRAARRRTVSPT